MVLNTDRRYVTALTNPLVWPAPRINSITLGGLVQNLTIEALPGPGARPTFGAGSNFRCAYGPGDAGDQLVEFHNATGTYSRGQLIARACPSWGPKRCSRTETKTLTDPRTGLQKSVTHTVNKGYPRCPPSWTSNGNHVGAPGLDISTQQSTSTHMRGYFRVRVWGKVCHASASNVQRCWNLKNPEPPRGFVAITNLVGYGATFRPERHCGPARWLSPAWQAAGGPPYAEWCDITVDLRNR